MTQALQVLEVVGEVLPSAYFCHVVDVWRVLLVNRVVALVARSIMYGPLIVCSGHSLDPCSAYPAAAEYCYFSEECFSCPTFASPGGPVI